MASPRRPTFSRCSTPSTLKRIHQMSESGTFSKTPRSLRTTFLGIGNLPPGCDPSKVGTKWHQKWHQHLLHETHQSKYFPISYLFHWCPEGDLNPHDRLRSAD